MGKNKHRGGRNPRRKIDEATRIRLVQSLESFRDSQEEVYTFEAGLSNEERALVHEKCRKMGMGSKSSGRGDQRVLSVFKKGKKGDMDNGDLKLASLTFSEEAKVLLQNLFTDYPPGDLEQSKEVVEENSGRADKLRRRPDDMFRKQQMSKAEIARKMESYSSRMEAVEKLKKVADDRIKLPITSFKDQITTTIESHQVVLISGETGCGKTTQVPQFLLDYMWGKGEACKIVCTQPRRISATSVAERISYERGENIGESIGYKIRLESRGGKHSSVVFCTNGILLRVLVSNGGQKGALKRPGKQDLSDITHIIVDEIHERDRFSDFMLAILRDVLPFHPHLRLILMSATLDAERFSQYFGGCPIIRVPGFTYPVKTFYLEDILSILKSKDDNHLDSTALCVPREKSELTEEDKLALDEAINLAWSNDEFDPLLELVSSEGSQKIYNYQHSLTGLTALMVFAGKGRVEDVCTLLSLGADSQLRTEDGSTALEFAEQEGQQEIAELLKEHNQGALSSSTVKQNLLNRYLEAINPELIDVFLIEQLLLKICIDSKDGAILVFLPGWDDINRTREKLLMNQFFKDPSKFDILSLHSMIPPLEQKKVFKRPPPGCRKIVLSTNIAETAITIDDVVYVIDSGRMKEKSYDPFSNVSTLQSSWVSKANARQREGRAGRCQPGICYHLYSKLRAASLPDFQVPEIKRMPIEELCLQVKLLDPDCKIEDFLRKTLDPPVFETIRNAIVILQDIGALSGEEILTELGQKLGTLPVHPVTSKMLFFAMLMNCLDPALTLACAADYKDPFTLPMLPNERQRAAAARSKLAALFGGHSDQLAIIAAFECWRKAKQMGQEKHFCSQYFVASGTMHRLSAMRDQLLNELIRNRLLESEDVLSCSLNARDPGILQAVIVAGLYPMVGRLLPPKNRMRMMVETASGEKVRLHPQSVNFKLTFKKTENPLLIYDEVTRGDNSTSIRNCTVIGPLPLALLSTEIAVAPAVYGQDEDDESDNDDEYESDEDVMDIEKSGGQQEEKLMSSPDNSVIVVVDRWLYFASTALDVAQIYCLRERLSAAILFKIKHPTKVLPPVLGASVYAVACILSRDGPCAIPSSLVAEDSAMVDDTEIESSVSGKKRPKENYLQSLISNQTHPHQDKHYRPYNNSRASTNPHFRR
ncbi:hypothetical protein UlMin_013955 [Ulmus minor]